MPFDELWPTESHAPRKISYIVGRDSHLDGDSSEYAKELSPNVLPSIEDGTTLPLRYMASISRTFRRLITPLKHIHVAT